MSQGLMADYLVKATGETETTVYLSTPTITINGSGGATDAIDFTIPSGVKKFSLILSDLGATGGSSDFTMQIGGVSGLVTTGYNCTSTRLSTTSLDTTDEDSGFDIRRTGVNDQTSGIAHFELVDPQTHSWSMKYNGADNNANILQITAGGLALGEELTTIRLSCSNPWTTSAMEVGCSYENPDLAVSYNGTIPAGVTDVFVNGVKQATTSGTEFDFTIPSGVKEVKVTWVDVSGSGSSAVPIIAIGDSGGVETSGYSSTRSSIGASSVASVDTDTNGFGPYVSNAAGAISGTSTLTLHDAATNHWVFSSSTARVDGTAAMQVTAGDKALSGELTTVRVTFSNGTDTFDGGSLNVQYDNQELDLGSGVISGGVVQTVNVQDGAQKQGTSIMPYDDTAPPQNTEGVEAITASITPTNAANKLHVRATLGMIAHSSSSSGVHAAALFIDSDADAVAAAVIPRSVSVNGVGSGAIDYWMTAGQITSMTFKLRTGGNGSGTTYINGNATRKYAGLSATTITITEYKA